MPAEFDPRNACPAAAPGLIPQTSPKHREAAISPLVALPFPAIDPVLIEIGPFAIRWYALAYVASLLLGWRYFLLLDRRRGRLLSTGAADDLLIWVALGVVLGGRLGYVLFYNLPFYLQEPLQALAVWRGGMSFHGGLLGVVLAIVLFARRRQVALLPLADRLACTVPIGLFFGRLANFINGELYGRASDAPWAMVFPGGGPSPRHPSQLYEAALEGLLLFLLVNVVAWRQGLGRRGLVTGLFLLGYGAARILVEFFREPDIQLGFLAFGSTMGQWLSLPMLAGGLYLIQRARSGPAA
ncbi:MAG: prolipoprotein diacylglyceryl transferase [Alphaproteobacteria bacterium]|nr:prolipoprotein diacylglyceryl transferase [Alphaproteobacteria bacterium]